MRVVLAGFNIEAEAIESLDRSTRPPLTPEVIAAAYARISRDPRSVESLRREARRELERARRSNDRIVFGLGHSSIAEHAVFNFDIMQISRLAVEEVEHFRLASFTEKSQRYIRLGGDIVIPDEIKSEGLARDFSRSMKELHGSYEKLFKRLIENGEDEQVAKEDARYLMPLATSTQLGMTVNARELEYMISRLASHPLGELRKLSGKLSRIAKTVAPSLVRYPEPSEYFSSIDSVRKEIKSFTSALSVPSDARSTGDVRLVDITPDADIRLAACMIFSSSGLTFDRALKVASRLKPSERSAVVSKTMRYMQVHDSVWREFENVHLVFELLVSASCYAQLKRHRMATMITQPYSPSLGLSIPQSVRRAKSVKLFREAASKAERTRRRLCGVAAADYALTNAHRRRVLLDINLRELYHFSRLRSDKNAQWEIKRISDRMCSLASGRIPSGAVLLCGKDGFKERKREVQT